MELKKTKFKLQKLNAFFKKAQIKLLENIGFSIYEIDGNNFLKNNKHEQV